MTPTAGGDTVIKPTRRRLRKASNILAWVTMAPVVAVSVFRAVPREWPTLVVQLVAFTPWLTVPGLLAIVLAVLGRRPQTVIVSAVVLGVQIFWLFPLEGRNSSAVRGPTAELTVMNINSELGQADPEEIVRLVRDNRVGLLTVQEHTRGLEARLAAAGLGSLLPNRISHPRDGAGGSAVYSVHPLEEVSLVRGTPFSMPLVRLKIRDGGRNAVLDLANVHAHAPVDGKGAQWRGDLAAVGRLAARPGHLLLIGDFNATFDHWEFRKLLDGGAGQRELMDVGALAGARLVPTWPMKGQHLPGITIDHMVTTPDIGSSGYSVHRVGGTDHAAITAALAVPAS